MDTATVSKRRYGLCGLDHFRFVSKNIFFLHILLGIEVCLGRSGGREGREGDRLD